MTKDEAIKLIKDDLRLHHDSLSGTYRKALNMAIESLKTDAIPVEWLESHMITHYEVVNGDYFADEAMELNLYVNDLIEKWREEQRKEE